MKHLHSLFSGRIDNWNYILGFIFYDICGAFVYGIYSGLSIPFYYMLTNSDSTAIKVFSLVSILCLLIIYLAFTVLLIVRLTALIVWRFHDMGRSGWAALLLLIPFFNVLVFCYLFLKGKDQSNIYGNPVSKVDKFTNIVWYRKNI